MSNSDQRCPVLAHMTQMTFLYFSLIIYHIHKCTFTFSALTVVGRQEGHPACKKLSVGGVDLLVVMISMKLCMSVVTTTSIILSSNKIQNGDILVPANPCPPGKMAIEIQKMHMNKMYRLSLAGFICFNSLDCSPGSSVSDDMALPLEQHV